MTPSEYDDTETCKGKRSIVLNTQNFGHICISNLLIILHMTKASEPTIRNTDTNATVPLHLWGIRSGNTQGKQSLQMVWCAARVAQRTEQ